MSSELTSEDPIYGVRIDPALLQPSFFDFDIRFHQGKLHPSDYLAYAITAQIMRNFSERNKEDAALAGLSYRFNAQALDHGFEFHTQYDESFFFYAARQFKLLAPGSKFLISTTRTPSGAVSQLMLSFVKQSADQEKTEHIPLVTAMSNEITRDVFFYSLERNSFASIDLGSKILNVSASTPEKATQSIGLPGPGTLGI